MNSKNGQSLIEVVFSIGIVMLVLTGVIVLMTNVIKMGRISMERKVAVELSQSLIEDKIFDSKNTPLSFWNTVSSLNGTISEDVEGANKGVNFSGYLYHFEYKNCNSSSCNIIFTIKWGDSQTLSVDRLFLRTGT